MPARRAIVLALLVLMVVAVLTVSFALRAGLPRGDTLANSGESSAVLSVQPLLSCVPTEEDALTGYAQECAEKVLTWMVQEWGLEPADATLASALLQSPHLGYACHAPAHAAGATAFTGRDSVEVAVRALRDGVCDSGLLHGVLDASAATMTGQDFAYLALRCEDTDREEQVGRCADGLGHVAGDRAEPSWCASFRTVTGQENCGGGFIMAIYQPVGADDPLPGVTWQDVAEQCHAWPVQAAPQGCASGAAYAFSRIFATQGVMLAVRPVSPAQQKSLVRKVLHAQNQGCALLPSDLVLRCRTTVLEYVPEPMARHDLMDQVCRKTDSTARPACYDVVAHARGSV